jgi:hypothetical protein
MPARTGARVPNLALKRKAPAAGPNERPDPLGARFIPLIANRSSTHRIEPTIRRHAITRAKRFRRRRVDHSKEN